MVSLKQKADPRALNWEPKRVTGCYWEPRKGPVKEKDYCSEQRMEPLTLMADHLEHLKVSAKQKADSKESNLVPLIAKGCCWEPRKDPLRPMADHLGR